MIKRMGTQQQGQRSVCFDSIATRQEHRLHSRIKKRPAERDENAPTWAQPHFSRVLASPGEGVVEKELNL